MHASYAIAGLSQRQICRRDRQQSSSLIVEEQFKKCAAVRWYSHLIHFFQVFYGMRASTGTAGHELVGHMEIPWDVHDGQYLHRVGELTCQEWLLLFNALNHLLMAVQNVLDNEGLEIPHLTRDQLEHLQYRLEHGES